MDPEPVHNMPEITSPIPPGTTSSHIQKTILVMVVGVLACVTSLVIGIYIGRNQVVSPAPIAALPTPTTPTVTPTPQPTGDWQTYSNSTHGFSIKYPPEWRVVETASMVGFGPKDVSEDIVWSVTKEDNTKTSVDDIIAASGKQFFDAERMIATGEVNGIPATSAIVTTEQSKDWYSVKIIMNNDTQIYTISNGALRDEALNTMILDRSQKETKYNFEDFFSSFTFI